MLVASSQDQSSQARDQAGSREGRKSAESEISVNLEHSGGDRKQGEGVGS